MLKFFVVGLGGFVGAVSRYAIGYIPTSVKSDFPIHTLVINFIGAFLIGIISNIAAKFGVSDSYWILFLKVGVCGGFTTFSTFSLEAFTLLENANYLIGSLYIVLSVLLCLVAIYISKMVIC